MSRERQFFCLRNRVFSFEMGRWFEDLPCRGESKCARFGLILLLVVGRLEREMC